MDRTVARGLAVGLCVALAVPHGAQAQFGGLINDVSRGARADASDTDSGCKNGKRSRGGHTLGGVLGGIAGRTARRTPLSTYVPVAQFQDTLTEAIACRLDPKEQEKAAGATNQAVAEAERSAGPQSASWKSETRDNVSGTSTVDSRTKTADGTSCMMVTDVVIVDGEETRAQKRMCRKPGQSRYTLAA